MERIARRERAKHAKRLAQKNKRINVALAASMRCIEIIIDSI
jgi:hypothetical protein